MFKGQENIRPLLPNDACFLLQATIMKAVGIKEALFLQHIHDEMLARGKKDKNGNLWVDGTLRYWHDSLNFMSFSMIRKLIRELEGKEVLLSRHFNQKNMDMTKWYTINYEKLGALLFSVPSAGIS